MKSQRETWEKTELGIKDSRKNNLKIKKCVSCGRFFYMNKWKHFSRDDFLKFFVRNSKLGQNIAKRLKLKKLVESEKKIILILEYNKKEYLFEIKIDKTICKECSLRKSEYYEGILQIRNLRKGDKNKTENTVDSIVRKSVLKTKGFIKERKDVKDGIDYYMSPIKSIRKAAFEVQKKLGGTISFNEKLITRNKQKSKNVYRVNAVVRLPPFKKGDVITNNNNLILLVTDTREKISCVNLKTGDKVLIDFKEAGNYEVLEEEETVVVKTHPKVEVLNPKTFQSSPLENNRVFENEIKKLKLNDKVRVVLFGGDYEKIYLVCKREKRKRKKKNKKNGKGR